MVATRQHVCASFKYSAYLNAVHHLHTVEGCLKLQESHCLLCLLDDQKLNTKGCLVQYSDHENWKSKCLQMEVSEFNSVSRLKILPETVLPPGGLNSRIPQYLSAAAKMAPASNRATQEYWLHIACTHSMSGTIPLFE